MSSLSSARVAETLAKLHADADAADRDFTVKMVARLESSGETMQEAVGKLIAEERADYRATYREHADHFLAISPAYGQFIYAIARARRATRIVEFGTSMGISTIYLAAAIRDNGGGSLIGSELEPTKVIRARANLKTAGLADLVEIREGDALDTLRDVGDVDLLSIDGAFSLYLPILKLIEPRLTPGIVILGENAFAQDYLDYVRNPPTAMSPDHSTSTKAAAMSPPCGCKAGTQVAGLLRSAWDRNCKIRCVPLTRVPTSLLRYSDTLAIGRFWREAADRHVLSAGGASRR